MRDILARANRPVPRQFACSRVLLAFDFDGTLAPYYLHNQAEIDRLLRLLLEFTPADIARSGRRA
jgi:trehalose-6-phosphatase